MYSKLAPVCIYQREHLMLKSARVLVELNHLITYVYIPMNPIILISNIQDLAGFL